MTETDPVAYLRNAHERAEELARAATPGPWEAHPPTDAGDGWEIRAVVQPGREWRWVVGAESGGGAYDEPDARLIALSGPAAVLARVAAERRILAGCLCALDEGKEYITGTFLVAHVIEHLAAGWGWTEAPSGQA